MSDNLRLEKCIDCGIDVWWSGEEPPKHASCESAKAMTTVTWRDDAQGSVRREAPPKASRGVPNPNLEAAGDRPLVPALDLARQIVDMASTGSCKSEYSLRQNETMSLVPTRLINALETALATPPASPPSGTGREVRLRAEFVQEGPGNSGVDIYHVPMATRYPHPLGDTRISKLRLLREDQAKEIAACINVAHGVEAPNPKKEGEA